MQTSIVEYFSSNEASKCGYCKGKNCSYSHGMWAHTMTVEDYNDLIDRGWRRSGRYIYKPTLDKTCCPQYTIRTDAVNIKLRKSHKKVMKRFRHFIVHGADTKLQVTPAPPPSLFDGDGSEDDESSDDQEEKAVEQQSHILEKKLKMNQSSDRNSSEAISSTSSVGCTLGLSSSSTESATTSPQKRKLPKPGSGPDPSKQKCRKAKDFRRQKALEKKSAKDEGFFTSSKPPNQSKNIEKTLEDFLSASFPENSRHKFETRLVMAQKSNREFMETFEESLQVYRKYQVAIHKDAPSKCTSDQFARFLCNSSLIYQNEPFVESGTTIAPGYGAFHQQYLIDGKIVAVGVIDILPHCVSSVYLYYDPDFSFLSFGTLSSLFELIFVRRLQKIRPALRYYYMGFYIHSCPKMRYKSQYSPSDLVCPVTYKWVPVEICLPILDRVKFSQLNPSEEGPKEAKNDDLCEVLVLYKRQAMQYGIYRAILPEATDSDDEDSAEVGEYKSLVGSPLSKRMLLFRK